MMKEYDREIQIFSLSISKRYVNTNCVRAYLYDPIFFPLVYSGSDIKLWIDPQKKLLKVGLGEIHACQYGFTLKPCVSYHGHDSYL